MVAPRDHGIIGLPEKSVRRVPLRPVLSRSCADFSALVVEARDRLANAASGTRLVSITAPAKDADPLGFFSGSQEAPRSFWERPFEGMVVAGSGVAWEAGDGPASEVNHRLRLLAEDAVILAPEGAPTQPILTAAFPFSPGALESPIWRGFAGPSIILPEVVVGRRNGDTWLTINRMVESVDDMDAIIGLAESASASAIPFTPPMTGQESRSVNRRSVPEFPEWSEAIDLALTTFRRGSLVKVVLARRQDIELSEMPDRSLIIERLRDAYPEGAVFAIARGEQIFLGATPEGLAEVYGGTIRVGCLAGSISRGRDEQEDRDQTERLLADDKNRREHDAVVQFVAECVQPITDSLDIAASPSILTVRNVHHLETSVVGRIAKGVTVLDAVAALHPTPAMAGAPVAAALDFIGKHESIERGLYASPVGWLNLAAEGDFAVAIRSALLSGNTAHLFAGCGIVQGSEPLAEWQETKVKLQPMLSALGIN